MDDGFHSPLSADADRVRSEPHNATCVQFLEHLECDLCSHVLHAYMDMKKEVLPIHASASSFLIES